MTGIPEILAQTQGAANAPVSLSVDLACIEGPIIVATTAIEGAATVGGGTIVINDGTGQSMVPPISFAAGHYGRIFIFGDEQDSPAAFTIFNSATGLSLVPNMPRGSPRRPRFLSITCPALGAGIRGQITVIGERMR